MENVSGAQLVLALVLGLAFLIFLILKTKIHAFLALISAAVAIGLIAGLDAAKITDAISAGFGGTLGSIGIIIGFGVMMGEIFQLSGAATRMARIFLKICGKGKEEIALAITGFIVSIPIFCDSAFVVLSPIAKAISRQTKKSAVGLGFALAGGLVITHSLVPPTPGPLGVAGLFGADIGKFILTAIVISIPMMLATTLYAKRLGKKLYQIPSADGESWERPPYEEPVYNALKSSDEAGLPSTFLSFLPIIAPIVLILGSTISSALKAEGAAVSVLKFLGTPVIAVGIGLVLAIYTLARKTPRKDALEKMENGIKSAGIIILVTGGGGALGRVLTTTGIGSHIAAQLSAQPIPVIVLPFLIATLIRFAQGSGTVAMTTSASICAPIVAAAGGSAMLGAFAACIGSLFFSYFNDSFFWVTNRLMGISDTKEQIRTWSFTTTIAWAVGFVELLIMHFALGGLFK
ncbi:MAG: GntP family permease [Spirochaetaceae bacterium]|jgi:GntP family gluconate:H+ symporter|nr:GntP family permease [Spirochaetaceae bacterium]